MSESERERQLAEAEVLARLGSWVWELPTNNVTWSLGLYRIFGVDPATPPTFEAFLERVHPDDRAYVLDAGVEGAAGHDTHLTYRIVRPDGDVRWTESRGRVVEVDDAGDAVRVAGVTIDLTDELKALEGTEAFRSIADAIDCALFTTTLDGTVTSWNAGAELLYGFPASEVLGRTVADTIVPPERADEADAVLGRVARGDRATAAMTLRRRRDGSVVAVSVVASPLHGFDGAVTGMAAVERDVSAELILLRQVAQATRLDAVDQLAAGIAHDFANVLTAVDGFLHTALAKARAGEDAVCDIERSVDAIGRGAKLVSRLLTFARPGHSQSTSFDVADVVYDIVPVLHQLAGDVDVAIVEPTPPPRLRVSGDPAVLEQMLVNLVVNGRDAVEGAGRIVIEYGDEVVAEPPATTVVPLDSGCYAFVRVADDGVGMDEATLQRCVDPLFTTKERGAGSGLGLASVVAAAKSCGGSVGVVSEVGRGTTVTVYWPLSDETAK